MKINVKLKSATPPLERRRVVVRGQQLNRHLFLATDGELALAYSTTLSK